MYHSKKSLMLGAMLLAATANAFAAPAEEKFTFQGQLKKDGLPVNGFVDLKFELWTSPTETRGGLVPKDRLNVEVVNGLFTVELDFAASMFSTAQWLEIQVRNPAGSANPYETLTPRQKINGAPYALYALNAPSGGGGGGTLDAAYDFGGAGAGRTINADAGPVTINGPDGLFTGAGLSTGTVELEKSGYPLDIGAHRGPLFGPNDPQLVSMGGIVHTGTISNPVDHFAYLRVTSSDHYIIRDPASNLHFSTQTGVGNSGVSVLPVEQMTLTTDRRLGIGTSSPSLTVEAWKSSSILGGDPTTMGVRHSITALPGNPPSLSWLYLSAGPGGNRVVRDSGTSLHLGTESAFAGGAFTSQVEVTSNGVLQVKGGSDVSLAGGGQLIVGATTGGNLAMDSNEIMARNNGAPATLYLNHENGTVALGAASPAGVGIGTASPKQKLHVNGDYYGRGHIYLYAFEGDGASGTAYVQARDDTSTTNIDLRLRTKAGANPVDVLTCKSNGRVGIGTTAPAQLLHVNGTARVNVLQITGGADLSENFDVISDVSIPSRDRVGTEAVQGNEATRQQGNEVEPGMVVAIDPANPGKLRIATQAYDRTVAGIISGAGGVATGMTMAHEGTTANGAHPVALTGRVYCHVDAATAAIEPGDLLTTSDTPGHAMKVTDHARAQGAIIGKAMTELAQGEKGLVLVLVSLQ